MPLLTAHLWVTVKRLHVTSYMRGNQPVSGLDHDLWDIRKIAADFISNLDTMPNDVKVKELTSLIRVLKSRAELEQLQKLKPDDIEGIAAAQAALVTAQLGATFHNHILIKED